MTALENVMVGRHLRTAAASVGAVLRNRATREEEAAIAQRAHELLLRRHRRTLTTWRATCPTATSAAWRSRARWPPSRSCWRSTNPPPA
jgi:hypothetical protein